MFEENKFQRARDRERAPRPRNGRGGADAGPFGDCRLRDTGARGATLLRSLVAAPQREDRCADQNHIRTTDVSDMGAPTSSQRSYLPTIFLAIDSVLATFARIIAIGG